MKKFNQAMILELIAGIFGWAWLIGIPIWIYFLVQWIRGANPWWYFAIAIAATYLCKGLTREYKKESVKAIYESTGKNYAQEWFDLPEAGQKEALISAYKKIASVYQAEATINAWIEKGYIDDMVSNITEGYQETGLKKPYQLVCESFVENFLMALVKK